MHRIIINIDFLMKIKLNTKDTNKLLWSQSPCTLRNVLQNPSMDQANRFHYGSIYFRDEVNKPKKVFTEFEKPQLLLQNFRRHIEEITLRVKKSVKKRAESLGGSVDKNSNFKISANSTENRFYQRPLKLQLKHDRFGNRSSYIGDYDVKDLRIKLNETKKNFYSSHRIDLSKPINFYPGPGSYFSQHQKNQKIFRQTYTERPSNSQGRSVSLKK